jgi:predicted SAM-dependent methyltransferase
MSAERTWDLDDLRAYVRSPEGQPVAASELSGVGRLMRRVVPRGLRHHLRALATDLRRPQARRRFAAAATADAPLRLHLACGFNHKDGWLNVDLVGARVDVAWNLAHGIPLPDESVDAIAHEHLLEHLTLDQGFAFTVECLRVLKRGAALRIGVPDAGLCLRSYAGQADPDWARSRPTPMLAVQALFYENGHRAMYDGETLAGLCRAAGFATAEPTAFGSGRLGPEADSPERRDGTLYVEAVKAPDAAPPHGDGPAPA